MKNYTQQEIEQIMDEAFDEIRKEYSLLDKNIESAERLSAVLNDKFRINAD